MPPPRKQPQPAPDIFVDRKSHRDLFVQAANAIPAAGCAIRVWHGVGGQGKSALARELFRMASDDGELGHVRPAMLNLHGRAKTDPDRLMVWVRNEFTRAGVETAAFDLAFAIMWEKTRGDEPLPKFEKPWLMRGGQGLAEQMVPEAITLTRELIEQTAETIPGLGFLVKKGFTWSVEKSKQAWLTRSRSHLQALYPNGKLAADHEIADLMPWMLAQDMNRHLARNPDDRFALFVDEYESVAAGAGTGRRWQGNAFDRHLQRFVAETDGLLALFFSREPLHWAHDPDWRDDLAGHQYRLDGLAEVDARTWLADIPIRDEALQSAIIDGAREPGRANAPVYPLLLELQVQHYRNLTAPAPADFDVQARDFDGRRAELVDRLLRDYGDAWQNVLQRLCLVERFDRPAFEHMVDTFNIPLDYDAFDRIADLSLMTLDASGWLSPHRAIADALVHAMPQEMRDRAVSVLLDHFGERARPDVISDVDDDTVICLQQAARLRLSMGAEGYAAWLAEHYTQIYHAARYQPLTRLWADAAAFVEQELGNSHLDLATCWQAMAELHHHNGRFGDGIDLMRQALDIRENQAGEDNILTAYTLGNLGMLLDDVDQKEQAEIHLMRSVDMHVRLLGEDNPETATCQMAVARTLVNADKAEQALPWYEKALDTIVAHKGLDHLQTAQAFSGLAAGLIRGADLDTEDKVTLARVGLLLDHALHIFVDWLGEDHPTVIATYADQAELLNTIQDYAGAEPLIRRVLAYRQQQESHNQISVAYVECMLAVSLTKQGRHEEAEGHSRRALQLGKEFLGAEHRETRRYRANLEWIQRQAAEKTDTKGG